MFLRSPLGGVAGQEQRSLLAAFQPTGVFVEITIKGKARKWTLAPHVYLIFM